MPLSGAAWCQPFRDGSRAQSRSSHLVLELEPLGGGYRPNAMRSRPDRRTLIRALAAAVTGLACFLLPACSTPTSSAHVDHTTPQPTSPSSSTSTTTDTSGVVSSGASRPTYADNRAAAAAESARVVGLVPLPGGATRLSSPPPSWAGPSNLTLGPSDYTLTRTAWWTVPVDAGAMRRVLLSNAPAGTHRDGGVGKSYGQISDVTYDQSTLTDPSAYTGVSLLVQWASTKTQDGKLLVRADTFMSARSVRNPISLVGRDARTLTIREIRATSNGTSRRMPTIGLTTPADRASIRAIAQAVDALRASTRPLPVTSCPVPPRPTPRLTMTFQTSPAQVDGLIHVYRMTLDAWCFGQLRAIRDGHPLKPPLDPGNLVETMHNILG